MIGLLAIPLLVLLTPAIWTLTVSPNIAAFVPSVLSSPRQVNIESHDPNPPAPASAATTSGGIPLGMTEDPVSADSLHSEAVDFQPRQDRSSHRDLIARIIPVIWVAGALLVLLNLAVDTWRVARFRLVAGLIGDSTWRCLADELRKRLGLMKSVELREHPGNVVPLTLGVIRPAIILPRQARDWPERLKRTVLLHELAHVRRRDVAYQWSGRLACALYWFHPLAWWAFQRLRQEREQACDDLVIHCGERTTEYAEDLVVVAKRFQDQRGLVCAVAMARHGNLEARMRSLFDADVIRSHAPLGRRSSVALLLLIVSIAGSVSAVQLAAQSGDESKAGSTGRAAESQSFSIVGADEPFADEHEYDKDDFPPRRAPGPLRQTVTVHDQTGNPVAGARVIPYGFGMESGASMGWFDEWPKEFTTNEQGVAEILVSASKRSYLPASFGNIRTVSFKIENPGYACVSKSMVSEFDQEPITLKRGIVIVPRAINAATGQSITSDLYAISSGYPAPEWTFRNGELRSVPIDITDSETGKYFRVIYAPAEPQDAPVLFSDVLDATTIEVNDQITRIDVPLYPGVRLSGQLSPNVPRPLKKAGHIVASIMAGDNVDQTTYPRQHVNWGDVAMIDADGNFEFSALPRDSHAELVAVCDGWLSKAKIEDLADYDQLHQTGFQRLNENPGAASTPVFIERDDVAVTLNMIQLGQCEILVEDENGKPLELAQIHFNPNHQTCGFGTYLGSGSRSLDRLRDPKSKVLYPETKLLSKWRTQYLRCTASDGRAVIANLPSGLDSFQVIYPGYTMPGDPRYNFGVPMGVVDIKSGETSKITIRMTPDANYDDSVRALLSGGDGAALLMPSFVDPEGTPLNGVRVKFCGQSLQQPGERQPWPPEWSTELNSGEFTSDEAGIEFGCRNSRLRTTRRSTASGSTPIAPDSFRSRITNIQLRSRCRFG
jgi:beta-lactamase regulating signal transducer with metallopeptidase domain